MAIRSILLAIVLDGDINRAEPSLKYAQGLAALENAHLRVIVGVPKITAPSGMFIPMVRNLLIEANAERRQSAETFAKNIQSEAMGAAVTHDIIYDSYLSVRNHVVSAARTTDIVILPQPESGLSNELDVFQAILFTSGRPVLMVPQTWNRSATANKIVIAWDGGSCAARAVGDAMSFLENADEVVIACVAPDKSKEIAGADLAAHLARHCKSLRLDELPPVNEDIAQALHEHANNLRADMRVMGAYGHSRLREFILGGVTRDVLEFSDIPVLFSH